MNRILIVDDEPKILKIMRNLFESEGFHVITAGDGSSGLQFVQENSTKCRMREAKDKLSLTFFNIKTIEEALQILKNVDPVEI